MKKSELLVQIWVFWCFNYHTPEKFLRYMSENGGCNFDYLTEKWQGCYEENGYHAVMNMFYSELDSKHKRLLVEYIMKFYAQKAIGLSDEDMARISD